MKWWVLMSVLLSFGAQCDYYVRFGDGTVTQLTDRHGQLRDQFDVDLRLEVVTDVEYIASDITVKTTCENNELPFHFRIYDSTKNKVFRYFANTMDPVLFFHQPVGTVLQCQFHYNVEMSAGDLNEDPRPSFSLFGRILNWQFEVASPANAGLFQKQLVGTSMFKATYLEPKR